MAGAKPNITTGLTSNTGVRGRRSYNRRHRHPKLPEKSTAGSLTEALALEWREGRRNGPPKR